MNRERLTQITLLILVIGVIALAGFAVRSAWRAPAGSSDRDTIVLVCLKCQVESRVDSATHVELPIDEDTGAVQCPACRELGAFIATLRCPSCQKAIPSTPERFGTAFECPYCQAPLGPGEWQPDAAGG